MSRLYWLIIDDEKPVFEPEREEYVYIVKRELRGLEFVFKTLALAKKCAERIADRCPEETNYISIHKKVVRTDYR